jgi:hypothetical protein
VWPAAIVIRDLDRIFGAARLDAAFLVQRQLFAQQQILRRELVHVTSRRGCH